MSWEDEARRYAQNADYWRERAEKAEKLLRMWNEVYAKDGYNVAYAAFDQVDQATTALLGQYAPPDPE